MGWGGDVYNVNVHVKYLRYRCYVVTWGGVVTAKKPFGRHSGVGLNVGFTEKNFASKFEYSNALSRFSSFALAALCMDVVLETQNLQ